MNFTSQIYPIGIIDMITHYPIWSQECAKKYLSRTLKYLLHGNVHDLVSIESENLVPQFLRLHEFLADEFFGARDIVLFITVLLECISRIKHLEKILNKH